MCNPKLEEKNTKTTKFPKHYICYVLVVVIWKSSSGKFLIGVAVKASIICFWWIGPWRRVRTWQHCFRFPAVFHICVPCDEESARAGASDLFVYCFTISTLWVIFYKLLFVLPFLRVFVRDNYLVHCLKFVPEKNIFNLDILNLFIDRSQSTSGVKCCG